MIKFFRKIRQQLLTEKKFSKYLLYAIGEIVLVVIGILIALQINNYNTNKRNIQKEQLYLNALYEELIQDSIAQKSTYGMLETMENSALYIMIVLDDPNKTIRDTIEFLNKFKYMMAYDQKFPEPVIWQELQSTGNLALIRDRALIKQLYDYYYKISSCEMDFANNAQPFINRGRYLDAEIFSVQTHKEFFEKFKIDEVPDKKVINNILNSKEIYNNTKSIVYGMLISKIILKQVMKKSHNTLLTLELLVNKETKD